MTATTTAQETIVCHFPGCAQHTEVAAGLDPAARAAAIERRYWVTPPASEGERAYCPNHGHDDALRWCGEDVCTEGELNQPVAEIGGTKLYATAFSFGQTRHPLGSTWGYGKRKVEIVGYARSGKFGVRYADTGTEAVVWGEFAAIASGTWR